MVNLKSAGGGAGRSFLVSLLILAIIALAATVLYLLSEINHRQYQIVSQNDMLHVERGRLLPYGFNTFEPESPDLKHSYAPIPVPPGEVYYNSQIYNDRADIDRALFALLSNWARELLESKTPGNFELGASYVRRCELLPGLSEEQRVELRTLRADLAYRSGRRILNDIVHNLRKALNEFATAKRLGTSQDQNIENWIADVKRRIRDYETTSIPQPLNGSTKTLPKNEETMKSKPLPSNKSPGNTKEDLKMWKL